MQINYRLFLACIALLALPFGTLSCTRDESKQEKPGATAEKGGEDATSPAPGGREASPPVSEDIVSPSEVVLLSTLWQTHTRGEVKFTHSKHAKDYKIACSECHHVFKKGENIWEPGMPVDSCEVCHNEPTIQNENKLPPGSRIRNLKLAFHKNCQGCHRDLKKENSDSRAPTTCSKCHEKKQP